MATARIPLISLALPISNSRHRSAFLGATKLHWLPSGHEICPSKLLFAADYSDSVPDSSSYVHNHGYHPLEELKVRKLVRDTKLTPAEIARTTGNSSALLVFPNTVHCEPHEHITWAEFQYIIDEYGDIFLEIFDDDNILQDRGANNPVNVLIGIDITTYENRKVAATGYNISEIDTTDDILFDDGYFVVEDADMSDIPVQWGMPTDAGNGVHPIYFAKCLTKQSVYKISRRLSPMFLYTLTSAIVEHFGEQGIRCNFALKALSKKKGLCVEAANLIGVDSLRMDVRVLSGVEVQTHRFPFKVRGFVSADVLVSSLEKAWLSLHMQETTTTFLTAALSSRKPEPDNTTASLEQGGSSRQDVPSLSTDSHGPPAYEDKISKLANKSPPSDVESSGSLCETTKESLSVVKDPKDSAVVHISSRAGDECRVPEKNLNAIDHHSLATTGSSQAIGSEEPKSRQYKKTDAAENNKIDSGGRAEKATVSVSIQVKKPDAVEEDKSDALDSCSSQSTDVYLNIRLLDDTNLQGKFLLTNTLRMVKDYVDENQASAFGSYDLAIPYPRKAFDDQDLNKTLSELGLFGRQALIVVPLNRATGYHRGGSSSLGQTISTTGQGTLKRSNEGYLGLVKRILSDVNPLSSLGGGASSSNSAQDSQSGFWQYSPNPGLQNNLRNPTGRSQAANSLDQSTLGNNSKSRQPQSTRFGSNIHTVKREEDDGRFSDRNAFWNGNSTQYGDGDNDAK